MLTRTLYIFIIGVLLTACGQQQTDTPTAARCIEEAEAALADDSIRQGETLLRKAIQLSEATEDWHTNYIAHQRLAEALSQSNPEEALRLMKQALTVYEQHPDDERNHVMLLDYAGTYAAQVAFTKEGPYDEALDFTLRAYDIARKGQMTDLVCQTLTSLANISWAKEDYRQAVDYARQAESLPLQGGDGGGLRPGTLQVLARSYLSLNMLDSAETVYRQIEPGDDVHMAYIVQSNLAKIALRRIGATQVEDSVAEAFAQVEDFYYKALEQKDEYYQETLRQEMENQQLEYRSQTYRRTLLMTIVASLIVILAIALLIRNRMHIQEQEKRQLQQEAEHQKTLLHQSNEVVAFLQSFILERTEVIKKLNQSGDSLITLSLHEWSEIERTLNAIDNNRFAHLREQYPDMTEDDIRLCILTRLGLSNRTIGNIYCITVSAVQHRKLKLKKDVFGETNPDVTLEQVLKS
ncbi:MAG: hypothetical protein II864_08955 [Prevotella sp.]|nr:hypothetical protein [Prevotella sp.]